MAVIAFTCCNAGRSRCSASPVRSGRAAGPRDSAARGAWRGDRSKPRTAAYPDYLRCAGHVRPTARDRTLRRRASHWTTEPAASTRRSRADADRSRTLGHVEPVPRDSILVPEISRASVICEVVAMHERLIPDVSLGTHFFNDLVEHDVLYVAYFPRKTGNALDAEWFRTTPSRLLELEPSAAALDHVVRVIDCGIKGRELWLRADATAQAAVVFRVG